MTGSTPAEILTPGKAGLRCIAVLRRRRTRCNQSSEAEQQRSWRRQPPNAGANVRCLQNRTSGFDPKRSVPPHKSRRSRTPLRTATQSSLARALAGEVDVDVLPAKSETGGVVSLEPRLQKCVF